MSPKDRGVLDKFHADVVDGKAYTSLKDAVRLSSTDVVFGFVQDGVQPFKEDSKYSIHPLAFTPLSCNPDLRYRPGVTTLAGIVPGTRDKNKTIRLEPYIRLMADELTSLAVHGVDVYDAFSEQHICVRAYLLTVPVHPSHCPLLLLPGFNTLLGLHYDPMHTIGGVLKDIMDLVLNSSRVKEAILE
ncbi:hypothetical protein PLESTM_001031400 [Pleodorina starrii]|nr:hypothetical protein PLESTM_001031400 [Pleodorina starrii]